MGRSVGCRAGKVVAVIPAGQGELRLTGQQTILVPKALAHLTDEQLLTECREREGELVHTAAPLPASKLRLAMVGAWGIPCGIATYAEALWPEVGKLASEWRVFAESPAEGQALPAHPNVVDGCWRRGESLSKLAFMLHAYKPDAVLIQHEYGLFPSARRWLPFLTQIRGIRPIVTLHSVYDHQDKLICEAACPEVVVHSQLAKERLLAKGASCKVHVLPHGCGPLLGKRLHNLYQTPHRFMQFGFGFRYKNWEASIQACSLLKATFPDIHFTGLFSEGMFSKQEHDRYYDELMAMAAALGVEDHVAIIRGYQSEQAIDAYLGTNAVAVFPYANNPAHVVYGASGAARRAMQAGLPVVVGKVPHFYDLAGTCAQAADGMELAGHLARLFTSAPERQAALERQAAFMKANSWANCAKATVQML